VGLLPAPPRTLSHHEVQWSARSDSSILEIPALQVRIRERPWNVLPYGPPVPVEIIDGKPD